MTANKFFISTDYAKFTIRLPNFNLTTISQRGTHEENVFFKFPKPISEDIAKILNKYVEKATCFGNITMETYFCIEEVRYESKRFY